MAKPTAKVTTLFAGPVSVDLESNTVSAEMPGGGQVSVGPNGSSVSVPGVGSVTFGPGGGSVETPAGRVEVRSDGSVVLNDGSLWNWRGPVTSSPGNNGGSGAPVTFAAAPITIPIPVPHFVVERFDIPLAIPSVKPHNVDLPLPIPHLQPTPVDVPWPFPSVSPPNRLPDLPQVPQLTPSGGTPARYANEIKAAIAQTVEHWIAAAEVTHGTINGPTGLIPVGALRSPVDFKAMTRATMAAGGVPLATYGELADLLADTWTGYFATFTTVIQFPAFAMWPGAVAPPMPAIGQLLSVGTANTAQMTLMPFYAAGINLPPSARVDADVEQAWRQLTGWFAARFVSLTISTLLMNVLGHGPVPTYAAPYSPAGPVVGGTIIASQGVLVGPNPFIVS